MLTFYRGQEASAVAIRVLRQLQEVCTLAKMDALTLHTELPEKFKFPNLPSDEPCACCGMDATDVFKFKRYQMCNSFTPIEKEHRRIMTNLCNGIHEMTRNQKVREPIIRKIGRAHVRTPVTNAH